MIRVVVNKEGEIFADVTGKKQGRGAYVSKDVAMVEKAQQKEILEKYFKASKEQLDPVYKEIIRLIYREESQNEYRSNIKLLGLAMRAGKVKQVNQSLLMR